MGIRGGAAISLIIGITAIGTVGAGASRGRSFSEKTIDLRSRLTASAWKSVTQVLGPAGFNGTGDEIAVNALSCGTSHSCSAVGFVSNHHTTQPFVEDERNGTWSQAIIPQGLAALNAGNSAQMDAVACTSRQNCNAVGWYTTRSQHVEVFTVRESNGKWLGAITVHGLSISGINAIVTSTIACASPINCVVSGTYNVNSSAQRMAPSRPFIVDEVNGQWQRAMVLPESISPADVNISSVACRSVGNCSIGGQFAGDHDTALIDNETNGVWAKAIAVPGIKKFRRSASTVTSISCGGKGSCSAGGTYANGSGDILGFLTNEVKGKWSEMQTVAGPPDLHLDSNSGITTLSCTAPGECTALGYSFYRGNGGKLFVVRESNGVWGRAVNIRNASNESYSGFNNGTLSCATPSNCVVGGMYAVQEKWSMGSAPFVAEEVNGVWTRAVEVRGIAKLNVGNYAWVQAASCGDVGNCAIVGGYSGETEAPAFFASSSSSRT